MTTHAPIVASPADWLTPVGGASGTGRARRSGDVVVLFPHAGGSALAYREWANASDDVSLFAVQPPGRGPRWSESPVASITELAGAVARACAELFQGRRIALLGHSMGGLVAFETALLLERWGFEHLGIVCIAACAPHTRSTARRERWSELPDGQLVGRLCQLGGPQPWDTREAREFFLPIVRADLRAMDSYRMPADSLSRARMLVLSPDEDDTLSAEDLPEWRSWAFRERFEIETLSGGHFMIHDHSTYIIGKLAAALKELPE